MLNFQDARERLRVVYGISIKRRDGEYRVNFYGGSEATAYYTTDLEDAWHTGISMSQWQRALERA